MTSPATPRPAHSRYHAWLLAVLALASIFFVSGCAIYGHARNHESGSVVQFLYPGKNPQIIAPQIPTLRLPLRVGVAFVPTGTHEAPYYRATGTFSEAEKSRLLREVGDKFKALPFIQSIEIVPTTYLRPGGGFENLDQLRSLMGIDVIALVAYDQSQNTSDTALSLAYWTIVGAYIVPSQKNDTHTLVEAVVYDIASRSLLFRAPGTDSITGKATFVGTDADLREAAGKSLAAASADMTKNLQLELDNFKVRLKEEPERVHIEHKPGYRGGGTLEGATAVLALLLLAGRRWLAPT